MPDTPDTPSMPVLCFIDTETGGLRTADRPWEIALVRREPDGTETAHLLHILDFRPADADPKALELGGFYGRHPGWTLTPVDLASELLLSPVKVFHHVMPEARAALYVERIVRNTTIVACNPGYDVPRLTALCERHGYAWTAHYRPVCATTLAAGRLALSPPWNNGAIGRCLGVEREAHGKAHGALPDALYARDLYDAALHPGVLGDAPEQAVTPA